MIQEIVISEEDLFEKLSSLPGKVLYFEKIKNISPSVKDENGIWTGFMVSYDIKFYCEV